MRFGNVSHTIIKIPKFFYENNNNLFKIKNVFKNYYKESKLINFYDDLNFNRNKRIKLTKLNKNFNKIKNFSLNSTLNNNNSTENLNNENKNLNNENLNNENKNLKINNSISSFKKNVDLNIETLLKNIKNNNYLKNREFNKTSLKKTFSFNNENNKFLIKNFEETMKEKILSLTLISDKIKIQCLNKNNSIESQKNFEEKNKKLKIFKLNKINKFNEKLFLNFNKNKKKFFNFKLKNSFSSENLNINKINIK